MLFASTDLVNGVGTSAFAAGSVSATITTIDFGSIAIDEKSFTITDAGISSTSKVIGGMCWVSTSPKAADDYIMDPIGVIFVPGTGSMTAYAYGVKGLVSGQYTIYYIIG